MDDICMKLREKGCNVGSGIVWLRISSHSDWAFRTVFCFHETGGFLGHTIEVKPLLQAFEGNK